MTIGEIQYLIEELKAQRNEMEVLKAEMEEAITETLSPEQIDTINNIKVEYGYHIERQEKIVQGAQSAVKTAIMEHGASVKHDGLQAVYNKGRVTWDSKKLDGYAVAHPEVLEFRKEGNPSVSIREVKQL